jgi:hypothetical protein
VMSCHGHPMGASYAHRHAPCIVGIRQALELGDTVARLSARRHLAWGNTETLPFAGAAAASSRRAFGAEFKVSTCGKVEWPIRTTECCSKS